jgi:predicted PurR-regulated permease PerM
VKDTTDFKKYLPPPWISALIVVALFAWIIYSLREMAVLLVGGYTIAYIITPFLDWLEKRNINRSFGVFIVGAVALIVVFLLTITILPRVFLEAGNLAQNLPSYMNQAKEKIVLLSERLDSLALNRFGLSSSPSQLIRSWFDQLDLSTIISSDVISAFLWGIVDTLLKGYSITLTLLNLALLPFLVYYFALDLKKIHISFLSLFPRQFRLDVRRIFIDIDSTVSEFIRGQITVALILTVLYGIGLGIIGVDLWFALALISGIGSLVPYLGGIVGVFLSTIMGLVTFGTVYQIFLIWLVFGLVQFMEGTFITPKIVGNKVGLSPLVVILALFAGASLFGILGILFAIPVAASLRVLTKHMVRMTA